MPEALVHFGDGDYRSWSAVIVGFGSVGEYIQCIVYMVLDSHVVLQVDGILLWHKCYLLLITWVLLYARMGCLT